MSKRIILSADHVRQLPIDHQFTIPESYLDEMGHMNIRWYMALFNEGIGPFLSQIGLTEAYFAEKQGGVFALEQFLRYLAEVHVGETVTVRGVWLHGRPSGCTSCSSSSTKPTTMSPASWRCSTPTLTSIPAAPPPTRPTCKPT